MPSVFQLEFFSFLWKITWVVNDKVYESKSHVFFNLSATLCYTGFSLAFNYFLQPNILPKSIIKSFSLQECLYVLSQGCTD